MNIVLNTVPSQTRQATTAADVAQAAPVRPAADQDAGAQAGIKTSATQGAGVDQIAHPAKRAAGAASGGTAQPQTAEVPDTAAAPNTAAKPASSDTAAANAANNAAAAALPLFAQLLGQAAQSGPVAPAGATDIGGVAKGDGKTDDKDDNQTGVAVSATDALLQAMAAPVMALPATPVAADPASAGTASPSSPVGATAAATPQVPAPAQAPASLAALLTVINPTAALNAQAMNAQAAIADARAQAQAAQTPDSSATTAQQTATAVTATVGADIPAPKTAAKDVVAASDGRAYSNVVAQLLGSRTAAPASAPLAATAPLTPAASAQASVAVPATPAPSLPTTAAAPAPHAADSDGTIAAAAADPTAAPGFGIAAPAASGAGNSAATLTLSGPAQQWQQPLQQALGDRLQMQLTNNSQQAVIRLEPPNLGSIEIAIRHADGALQVNLSASNSDVLRQLHTIGDSVRQDLSARQYTDVAVTVSAAPRSGGAQNFADGGGDNRQRQSGQDGDERTPGRALSDADQPYGDTFALNDRE